MPPTIRQYFAARNGNTLPAVIQQNIAVDISYRTTLSGNVDALLRNHGRSSDTLGAVYLDGPKKGERVSPRTIRNLLDGKEGGVGIDAIAAIAAALKVQVYHLLVPGLDPESHPPAQKELWIEAEVERRVAAHIRKANIARKRLEAPDVEGVGGKSEGRRLDTRNPFFDSEASVGSTPSRTAKVIKQTSQSVAKRQSVKQGRR